MAEFAPERPENGPPFIKTRGLRFPNDLRVIPPRRRKKMRDGTYERQVADAVLYHVLPDDVVIELGAGMGFLTGLIARNAGAKAVHAYEPNPDMIPYVDAVCRENGVDNVTLVQAALGARKGSADFYRREDFAVSSLEPEPDGDEPQAVEKVDVLNVRSVMKEVKPTLMVCDVGGAEADLLQAADLKGLRCAVVKLYFNRIGEAGVAKVFAAMAKAGLTYDPRGSWSGVVAFRKGW